MVTHTKTKVNPPPRPAPSEPRVVTNTEAARQLDCSVRSVQRWRRKGLLETCVIHGRARVTTASIRALVESGVH